MRFNLEDLKRGNVGKARIDEVVLKTIYKIDEKFAKREDILRSSLPLVDFLQKQFIFKKAEGDDKETVEEKMYFKKNMDILKFFNKIALANIQLLQYEAILAEIKKQEQQKAYMHNMARLSKDLADKVITDFEYQRQASELQAEQYRALLAAQDQRLDRIDELLNHRDNLYRSIEQHEENIKGARVYHAEEALKYVDEIKVGDVSTFEGMSNEQKENFVHGMFAIEEIKTRQLMDVDNLIDEEESRLAASGEPSNGMMLQFDRAKRTSPLLDRLRAHRTEIVKEADKAINLLGDAVGHKYINSSAPKEVRDAHLGAVKKHEGVSNNLSAHVSIVRHEHAGIINNGKEIKVANELINMSIKDSKNALAAVDKEKLSKIEDSTLSRDLRSVEAKLEALQKRANEEPIIKSRTGLFVDYNALDQLSIDSCKFERNKVVTPSLSGMEVGGIDIGKITSSKDEISNDLSRSTRITGSKRS